MKKIFFQERGSLKLIHEFVLYQLHCHLSFITLCCKLIKMIRDLYDSSLLFISHFEITMHVYVDIRVYI